MTDKEIVERAKKAEKRTCFGELMHSPISKGVNSAFGIGFIEGMVEYRNSLQEEPISIWHDSNEKPNIKEKGGIFVITLLNGEYIGSRYYNYNNVTINFGNYDKWAYLNDLINLSNVERIVKNWKEPVSEDLEEASRHYVDSEEYGDDVYYSIKATFKAGAKWQKEQFEKDYTNLCNGIAIAKGLAVAMAYDKGMADAREQMMANIWKSADGDDLPEIDKEVIALIEAFGHYKVIFAHRVDKNAEIHTSIDGKPLVLHPKRYDKGGWNIPDIKWWLDCSLPNLL